MTIFIIVKAMGVITFIRITLHRFPRLIDSPSPVKEEKSSFSCFSARWTEFIMAIVFLWHHLC